MSTSDHEQADELPGSSDGDVSTTVCAVGDGARADMSKQGNDRRLNDCGECGDGCDRRQAQRPGSNRARREARVSTGDDPSDKGLFYVPYRAASTSPIPNSLGFSTAEAIRQAAQSAARISEAVGDEPFGMVIGPGVVRLVTGKQATEANVAFSTRDRVKDIDSTVVPT
ncbi:MAG: hypothetical protein HQ526_05735, partial [Actinobacteria bacterium]|nr:hypothetical protein [Actinomycetota bacterium]